MLKKKCVNFAVLTTIVLIIMLSVLMVLSIFCVSAETYTITYNKNGGDGLMGRQTFTVGESLELRNNTFNRRGYVFRGWSLTEDGTIAYEDMETISNLSESITLYAQWVMWGDTNSSGSVTIQDATQIQKYIADMITFTDDQLLAADTNCDGVITAHDATKLQKYLNAVYHSTVNNYFDNGLTVYYGETQGESSDNINRYMDSVCARYRDLLHLEIVRNNASYYDSVIDKCKGTVTSLNIDSLCDETDNHTDASVLRSYFGFSTLRKDVTNILWTGHKVTSTAGNNRSFSHGRKIMMLSRPSETERDTVFESVLMHELNHQYGADDHYHELDATGTCKSGELCSYCGTNPRPSTCIMNTTGTSISSETVLCDDCKFDMSSWIETNLS